MIVDVGIPRTWVKYREGMCNGCWATCCNSMPVEVNIQDMIGLGLTTEDEVRASPSKTWKRLKAAGFVKSFRVKTGLFTLEQRPNGDCVFLNKERLCSVYEKRPSVCREFPKIGPRPGYCPKK